MNKHYDNIHRYDFLTKEVLEQEYTTNGLSDQQIADKFQMPSKTVVWSKRKKFGIKNRTPGKSNVNAVKNRKFNITKPEAVKLLEDGKSYKEIAEHMGCSIIVAKRRFKELGLTKNQEHSEKYTYWEVELSDAQKQLLIGSTLGDGTIAKHGAYSCSHSTKQENYHKHKMEVLASIHSGKFQHAMHKAQGKNGKHHESLHFTTGCNEFCSKLRQIYYPSGKKIFPHSFLIEQMNVEALAYWYMDDGTYNGSNAKLCTYGWDHEDQLLIQALMKELFDLKAQVKRRKVERDYYQMFTSTETPKLFALICPYVIPSMLYKVDYQAYLDKDTS